MITTSRPGSSGLDEHSLRTAFGTCPSGVVAVCGLAADGPVGMAVSTFVPVSMTPPLAAICVQRTSRTWAVLRTLPALGISVLADGHEHAARALAAKDGDRFAGLATDTTADGAVHVLGGPTRFVCSLEAETEAGDHLIATLRVHTARAEPAIDPLVFHRSGFARVSRQREGYGR
ncbi:flavin reductase family protein [Amycolatopsis pithecellobii]|uniref:Oxidoreductase n=1 Tax=Amycolatopsis pithecellobii TaxID=664692 RepID=A0A6N7YYB2_9PSEU|nr:flavin reductase family protein [Amycolatopsis pithecellobii]MTD52421.1 oxidoreductase [Amycolatopsis pithecellobii]